MLHFQFLCSILWHLISSFFSEKKEKKQGTCMIFTVFLFQKQEHDPTFFPLFLEILTFFVTFFLHLQMHLNCDKNMYLKDLKCAYNQDVFLIRKSRSQVCLKTRRVTKRDALVLLATLRYLFSQTCLLEIGWMFLITQVEKK